MKFFLFLVLNFMVFSGAFSSIGEVPETPKYNITHSGENVLIKVVGYDIGNDEYMLLKGVTNKDDVAVSFENLGSRDAKIIIMQKGKEPIVRWLSSNIEDDDLTLPPDEEEVDVNKPVCEEFRSFTPGCFNGNGYTIRVNGLIVFETHSGFCKDVEFSYADGIWSAFSTRLGKIIYPIQK